MATRSSRRRKAFVRAGLPAAAATAVAIMPQAAQASHCAPENQPALVSKDGDEFRNWDYESAEGGQCNVDWPVDFLFFNDAEIDKVKNRMANQGYDSSGATMHARLNDVGNWEWDADAGRKNQTAAECVAADAEHYRIYSAGSPKYGRDRMWTPDWGYYVLATAHIDHAECTNGWSGRSEVAEHRIAQDANEEFVNGYVNEDCCYFHNPAGYKDYVHHITENDGYATAVFLP